MNKDCLKLPMVEGVLEKYVLELEEWRPQLEDKQGIGPWSADDIAAIAVRYLFKAEALLKKINFKKLKSSEKKEYNRYLVTV